MKTVEYKDTEIGRIPADWIVTSIKEAGTLVSDGINPQLFQDKDFVEYSMPAYDEGQAPSFCKGVTMNSNRTKIQGEVLLFNKLNVRQKRVWHVQDAPVNAVCSMEFLAYKSNIINLSLLREILLQDKVTNEFISVSRGTSNSQKRIAPSDFLNYKIALPATKAEQNKIASCLSSMNDLIASIDKAIEKKRLVKEGLMLQLLTGKTRVPGYDGEWTEKKISEFGYMVRGVSYSPEDSAIVWKEGYAPLMRSNNIQNGRIVYDDFVFVDRKNISDNQYMNTGDIIICTANGSKHLVGKSAIVTSNKEHTFGAFMGVFRCYDYSYAPFISALFQSSSYRRQLDDILTGSAINNLNASSVEGLKFRMPVNKDELIEIANSISSANIEIQSLEAERDKYILIKQGMMQELLTGKTRLI